jgi:hypothetical protein
MDYSTSHNVYAILAQFYWVISLPENPPGALVSRVIPGDFMPPSDQISITLLKPLLAWTEYVQKKFSSNMSKPSIK